MIVSVATRRDETARRDFGWRDWSRETCRASLVSLVSNILSKIMQKFPNKPILQSVISANMWPLLRILEISRALWNTTAALWSALMHSEAHWDTLQHSEGLWCTLEITGALCSTVKLTGTLCSPLKCSDAFWSSLGHLEHSAALWCILELTRALWSTLKRSDAFWSSQRHFGAFWSALIDSGAL